MEPIKLELPIKIRKTVGEDGYVITDTNDVEHFFYEKEKESEEMEYDGFCAPVKFDKLVKQSPNSCLENENINSCSSVNLTEPSEFAKERIEFKLKVNSLVNSVIKAGVPLPRYDYEKRMFTVELPINRQSIGGGVVGSIKTIEFDLFYDALEYIISWKDNK